MAEEDVKFVISADTAQGIAAIHRFTQAMEGAGKQGEESGKQTVSGWNRVSEVGRGAAVAAGALATAIGGLAMSSFSAAEGLFEMSQRMGVGVRELSVM